MMTHMNRYVSGITVESLHSKCGRNGEGPVNKNLEKVLVKMKSNQRC